MGRFELERLNREELIELVLRLQRPEKTSRTSSKPPSTDRKEQGERSKPGGAKPLSPFGDIPPGDRCAMGWQRASGYSWRALVESDISRWKRVVDDGLRFQTDERQATEVAIAVDMLNRMLDLGRPEYVRTA